MKLDKVCEEVIEETEWIAITTASENGPHTVAAWGHRLRKIGIQDGGIIVLPVGKYFKTEENLWRNPDIQLVAASSEVQRDDGMKGQGYRLVGKGEIQREGPMADRVKAEFPWARGALVARIERIDALVT